MDEGIRRIFRKHFDQLEECAENTQARKTEYSYAMVEITDLYADICGISYDAAASELRNAEPATTEQTIRFIREMVSKEGKK